MQSLFIPLLFKQNATKRLLDKLRSGEGGFSSIGDLDTDDSDDDDDDDDDDNDDDDDDPLNEVPLDKNKFNNKLNSQNRKPSDKGS